MIDKIAEILVNKGIKMSEQPGKLLSIEFDDYRGKDKWKLVVNGNSEKKDLILDGGEKLNMPAFGFAIFWNGWLAGLMTPGGGQMAAHKEGANKKTFLRSLKLYNTASK